MTSWEKKNPILTGGSKQIECKMQNHCLENTLGTTQTTTTFLRWLFPDVSEEKKHGVFPSSGHRTVHHTLEVVTKLLLLIPGTDDLSM